MVTPHHIHRLLRGSVLLAAVVACGPRPLPQAVPPDSQANAEATPLLEKAATDFGNRHPHKLQPRLVWARGTGFDIIRHEISGAIVARGVGMGMYVFDTSNSQCWMWVCDMYQQEIGGGRWGDPVIAFEDCLEPSQVTCESMDRVIAQVQGTTATTTSTTPPPEG
jgi:hypothetical protein